MRRVEGQAGEGFQLSKVRLSRKEFRAAGLGFSAHGDAARGRLHPICFSATFAAHVAPSRTFLFFGDVYAKAGRIEDARSRYQLALAVGQGTGWRAEFLAEVQQRLDDLPARVARFQDGDPSNDPPMVGVANAGCAHCHYQ